MDEANDTKLAELEAQWRERFAMQPKLPSPALLTGALAMALGFGAVLFLISARVRGYAWIWIVLSALFGMLNRVLARRWFERVVVPWSEERAALKVEIERLRGETKARDL